MQLLLLGSTTSDDTACCCDAAAFSEISILMPGASLAYLAGLGNKNGSSEKRDVFLFFLGYITILFRLRDVRFGFGFEFEFGLKFEFDGCCCVL
jgi:hypothetical protein